MCLPKRRNFILSILSILFAVIWLHSPKTHAQTEGTFNLIGRIGGKTEAIFVDGNTAYISMGDALVIIDVSDSANPMIISRTLFPFGEIMTDIEVVESVAYITGDRLFTVDVSDPAAPALLGSVDTMGDPRSVEVVESVAYVANRRNGLLTVDVSNPTAPALLGSFDTDSIIFDIEVVGSVAYIADYLNGLKIVDVSDPSALALLGSYDIFRAEVVDIAIAGGVAYIANYDDRLLTVDVSDPTAPTSLGFFKPTSLDQSFRTVASVEVVGNVAYIMTDHLGVGGVNDIGLVTADITDPSAPVYLGAIRLEHTNRGASAKEVAVVGNVAYTVNTRGLFTVDVSDPSTPFDLGSIATIWYAYDVKIVEGVAYIASRDNGLVTVDVSDPSAPVYLGVLNTIGNARGVEVVGDVAYITDGYNRFVTIDVSDPSAPTLLWSADSIRGVGDPDSIAGYARRMQVVGNLAYIADGGKGLITIDISDPSAPILLQPAIYYGYTEYATDVQVIGNIAYTTGYYGGFEIVDVSDPSALVTLGSVRSEILPNDMTIGVEVVGNIAYLLDQDDGLLIVDVSDPSAPVHIGALAMMGETRGMDIVDNMAYITTKNANGLLMVDVSNPVAPIQLGSLNIDRTFENLQVVDDVVYVATGENGLYMFEYEPAPPTAISTDSIHMQTKITTALLMLVFLSLSVLTVLIMQHYMHS